MNSQCKYCGNEKKLIKAHVIPASFFKRLRNEGNAPKLISQSHKAKRSQLGVYDQNILCEECEKLFGAWDEYAHKLLVKDKSGWKALKHNGTVMGYEVLTYDYDLLKLFFISLMWRASVSSQPFYQRIRLGPHEERLKAMLVAKEPGSSQDYGVVLAAFDHPLGSAILDPHPEKFPPGINYTRFYLGGYVAYIKTDRREVTGSFANLQLSRGQPLRIVLRDLENSKELPLLYKIVAAANKSLKVAP